jgi:hypothetical protein
MVGSEQVARVDGCLDPAQAVIGLSLARVDPWLYDPVERMDLMGLNSTGTVLLVRRGLPREEPT